jgi:hypothetical protein
MRLATELERARGFVAQYEEHQGLYRDQIEKYQYDLGKLDERSGG